MRDPRASETDRRPVRSDQRISSPIHAPRSYVERFARRPHRTVERAVCTSIHHEPSADRRTCSAVYCFTGPIGTIRARSDIERHRLEIDGALDLACRLRRARSSRNRTTSPRGR